MVLLAGLGREHRVEEAFGGRQSFGRRVVRPLAGTGHRRNGANGQAGALRGLGERRPAGARVVEGGLRLGKLLPGRLQRELTANLVADLGKRLGRFGLDLGDAQQDWAESAGHDVGHAVRAERESRVGDRAVRQFGFRAKPEIGVGERPAVRGGELLERAARRKPRFGGVCGIKVREQHLLDAAPFRRGVALPPRLVVRRDLLVRHGLLVR